MQPRVDTSHNQDHRHQHGPQLEIEHIDVEVGIHGRDHRGQDQGIEQIAAHAVVLPDGLGAVWAAQHGGDGPHGEADGILQCQDDAGGDAQVAVDRVEVAGGALLDLVGLDEQHAGGEEQEGEQVEGGVGAGAGGLFRRGPGRL